MNTGEKETSVSIIIPAYNRADLLPEAIDSVVTHAVPDMAVVAGVPARVLRIRGVGG